MLLLEMIFLVRVLAIVRSHLLTCNSGSFYVTIEAKSVHSYLKAKKTKNFFGLFLFFLFVFFFFLEWELRHAGCYGNFAHVIMATPLWKSASPCSP